MNTPRYRIREPFQRDVRLQARSVVMSLFGLETGHPAMQRIRELERQLDRQWRSINRPPEIYEPVLAYWPRHKTIRAEIDIGWRVSEAEWRTKEGATVYPPSHWQPLPDEPADAADPNDEHRQNLRDVL